MNYGDYVSADDLYGRLREFWQKQTGQLYDFCVDQVNLYCKRKVTTT